MLMPINYSTSYMHHDKFICKHVKVLGSKALLEAPPPFFAYSCSISQGGSFGAKKMKIDRGNPKLEHGQRLVNDQTCLNK